jgi:hypothetical protein
MHYAKTNGTPFIGEFGQTGSSVGRLSLRDAQVSGNIDVRYTQIGRDGLDGEQAVPLDLVRTTVGGSVFVSPGNTIHGSLDASDVRVSGNVSLVDVVVVPPAPSNASPALQLSRCRIEGSLFLNAPQQRTEKTMSRR